MGLHQQPNKHICVVCGDPINDAADFYIEPIFGLYRHIWHTPAWEGSGGQF